MPRRIVIIGSGPTAIGAAIRIRELVESGEVEEDIEVTIVEKESTVGGLARSVTDERGFTWDLGVHVTGHSRYPAFLELINSVVDEWNCIPRNVKAHMRHVLHSPSPLCNYVPYPVQDSVPYFPDEVKTNCLSELSSSLSPAPSSDFGAFSRHTFGKTLQDIFIRPYNEKVWTVSLEEMNTAWVDGRVPRPDLRSLEQRCQLTRDQLNDEADTKDRTLFRYPCSLRGVGEMWQLVCEKRLDSHMFRYDNAVQHIDVEARTIRTSSGLSLPYDEIISTMPIVELGRVSGLEPRMPLKHSKVILVGVGIRRPQPAFTQDMSWMYFPEHETSFYRCTFISNFNEHMTPNAALYWSVICEIGCPAGRTVDEEETIDRVIQDLHSVGILPASAKIVDRWSHVLPFGYPIPCLERDSVLAAAHSTLERHAIYSRGRFGAWKYETANQDHSYQMGREVAERILLGGEEKVLNG